MPAYASNRHEFEVRGDRKVDAHLELVKSSTLFVPAQLRVVDQLIDNLVDRIAGAIAERLAGCNTFEADEWFDSRRAAEYLDVHRDTLRKLAAQRTIPSEQDGPGCKLYFRRTDLDRWRRSGGRPVVGTLPHAA